jgi:hypothetical protein
MNNIVTTRKEQGTRSVGKDSKVYLTVNCINLENKLKREEESWG